MNFHSTHTCDRSYNFLIVSFRIILNYVMSENRGQKRKRVVLSLVDKITIIQRLRKGDTASRIALDYGIGRTTLNDVKKKSRKN